MSSKKLEIDKNIGKRIKKIRLEYGLNGIKFAESIGIKQGTLSEFETGKNDVRKTIVLAISYIYNVNPDWLLTGEGEPYRKADNSVRESTAHYGGGSDIVRIHQAIVEKFNDKARAKRINEKLLALEAISADALREIEERLDLVLLGAKLVTPDRRRGQRRQQNDHARAPDHDRRSGRDRRKAIGER